MRIGITGHQELHGDFGWDWVEAGMRSLLLEYPPPRVGLTSLAAGADQRFAEVVLELGGTLEVIVPFAGYETRFTQDDARAAYHRLLAAAETVRVLPRVDDSDEASYLAAGRQVVDGADLLIAVWDGRPAGGPGGTADIVAYAEVRGVKVLRIDPVLGSIGERGRPQ
ncbi:MAG: hypothetical protein QOJ16_412 [Acidobacteriota bacterium]|nr:hypothetical protein [Acidobacteriota bacterium]